MKKLLIASLAALGMCMAFGQNYVSGPMGVYGPQYNAATTIGSGGSVLAGSGGNWVFGGNIVSADKGNSNSPTATGRSEAITFDGNATYTINSYTVDGYAASTATWTGSILPIGNSTTAYPLTVPTATVLTAAYFDGLGSTQTAGVGGTATTVFSPYIDVPAGLPNGSYTLSYPSGFTNSGTQSILSAKNTAGTTAGTTYSSLSSVTGSYSTSASTMAATITAPSASQVYFGTSSTILPIVLVSFTATATSCTAHLAWLTSTELNSSYYGVEAGSDGASFSQVAKVSSKNSATGAAYAYNYALGSGTTYFRLKAVDNDGKFTYSPVVAVTGTGACSTGVSVKVSPNPTRDVVNIQGLVTGSTVTVYGINGQKMTSLIATGTNQSINMRMFANGVYILRISAVDGSVSNLKVIKN